MISLSSLIYEVTIYSSSFFLEELKRLKIHTISLKYIKDYTYLIEIPYKNKSDFESNFKAYKLIKVKGIVNIFNKLLLYKFTVFSFIISCIFFFYLSSLLMVIEIKGNSPLMNEKIELFLNDNNIKKYVKMPSNSDLEEYKNTFFFSNLDTLKDIEFYTSGNKLIIKYFLKDNEIILENKKGKMYSSCDAIISKIEISSGNVLVKENMFVRKGDLLVDDYFYYKESPVFIGTSGRIYGYTYNLLEIKTNAYDSEVESFSIVINEARNRIYNTFNDGDRIDKEEILSFKYNKKNNYTYLKVLYTNYINIVSF